MAENIEDALGFINEHLNASSVDDVAKDFIRADNDGRVLISAYILNQDKERKDDIDNRIKYYSTVPGNAELDD